MFSSPALPVSAHMPPNDVWPPPPGDGHSSSEVFCLGGYTAGGQILLDDRVEFFGTFDL